jgi:hypothetical protein
MDYLNNLVGRQMRAQRGGADPADPDSAMEKYWPGWGFIINFSLVVLAFVLIGLLFSKAGKIEETLGKIGGDVKSSTGILSTLKDALSKFGEKPKA